MERPITGVEIQTDKSGNGLQDGLPGCGHHQSSTSWSSAAKKARGWSSVTLFRGLSGILGLLVSCGRPEPTPEIALRDLLTVGCGTLPSPRCIDTLTVDSIISAMDSDSLEGFEREIVFRREGEDVRHVDIRGEHAMDYFWSEEGWIPRPSPRAQKEIDSWREERVLIEARADVLGQYSHENLHGSEPSINVVAADSDWYVARALDSLHMVDCLIYEGSVPAEHRALIEKLDAP